MPEDMFARLLTPIQVAETLAMLRAELKPRIEEIDGWTTAYNAEGKIVFQAIPKSVDCTNYVCRFDDQVFDRDSTFIPDHSE